MFLQRKWCYAVTIFIVIALSGGGYYMYRQEYQMVVTVPTADANDPNWPNKRIRFDASEWLRKPQYIKINDIYLLNTQYVPITDLDSFKVTLALQKALDRSDTRLRELAGLAEMDAQMFKELMHGKIACEYLRTRFDADTLKPVRDYFLISFSYKDKKYEFDVERKISKISNEGYSLWTTNNTVHEAGYWHNTDPAAYSYRDYVNGVKNSIRE